MHIIWGSSGFPGTTAHGHTTRGLQALYSAVVDTMLTVLRHEVYVRGIFSFVYTSGKDVGDVGGYGSESSCGIAL